MDIFKSAFLQLPDELKIHIIDQVGGVSTERALQLIYIAI